VKLDEATLLRVEKELVSGQVQPESIAVLLEALRHLQRCVHRHGAARRGSERRRPKHKARRLGEKKSGHGRIGADAYTGAEREDVPHPKLKPGDGCPNEGCCGSLYDMKDPASKVELRGSPPVRAKRYDQQRLRCSACQETFTAPLPAEATGKKFDPSVDATLALTRYGLGLPHNRLEQWQGMAGIPLPASTQFERVELMANVALPVLQHLENMAADRSVIHSDDTGARIVSLRLENDFRGPGERTGVFSTGIVARGLGDEPAIVLYKTGRNHAGENMDALLKQRSTDAGLAVHMADASSMAPQRERISSNCLVHARRYFIEIENAFPEQCGFVLDAIAAVFHVDEAAKNLGLDPEARLRHHQEHSKPVMDALRTWIDTQFEERLVEPNSRLGTAMRYMTKRWAGLTRFLEVAGAPIDNNVAEREIKPVQRHRKNSLFFKNETGAAVGDVLLSVIRTCTINGHDPVRYLTALGSSPSRARANPGAWLPWNYEKQIPPLN
jgi:transposase